MFKKIQNHLLLHHPLLWNLKIVPVACVTLLIHIILFIAGYTNGYIDFAATDNNSYLRDGTFAVIMFFCSVSALFIFIIWLVFYFRNNSFKTFYPKNNASLYKEWLLIFAVCFLNTTYPLTYAWASNLKATSYLSEDEFSRRIDIMTMASVFKGDDFNTYGNIQYDSITGAEITRSTYPYFGKEYSIKSLLNKATKRFSYQDFDKDSILEYRVKGWLHNNQKDSVLWLMKEMDNIVKAHNLKATITPQQWLDLVYNSPDFITYAGIETKESYILNLNESYQAEPYYNDYNDEIEIRPDSATVRQYGDSLIISDKYNTVRLNAKENTIKMIKGIRHIYPKYVVPFNQLENSYGEIGRAYKDRNELPAVLLGFIYFCFTLSAVIFSFRLTSGLQWLISLVSFGITAIITGIICVIIEETIRNSFRSYVPELYFGLWVIIEIVLLSCFVFKKNKKGNTAIILNIAIWLLPWLLPAVTGIILELLDKYYTANYHNRPYMYDAVKYFITIIAVVFAGLHFVWMYFFSRAIKRWKGMAEA